MTLRTAVAYIFILSLVVNRVSAQSSTPGGSVRLTVHSGGNLDFVFNSIAKYKSGITYSNWTILGITVTDNPGDNNAPPAVDDYTQWRIYVEAADIDGDGAITGTTGLPINTLPFSTIEMGASIDAGCGTCNIFYPALGPFLPLPAPGMGVLTPIADGSNAPGWPPDQITDFPSADNLVYTTDRISITYRCGVTTALLDSPSDYYSDDIVFTLEMLP